MLNESKKPEFWEHGVVVVESALPGSFPARIVARCIRYGMTEYLPGQSTIR